MGNVRMRAEQINYGATNVKVALDDLDPAALIELNNRMNRIDAWKATVKTEEKTGAEVTFTNALALAAVSLSADIVPIQDLHGYDHPWVGGANSNKWDEVWENGTFNTSTGANINTGSTLNQIRAKNLIPVTGGSSIYVVCPLTAGNQGLWTIFYDSSKNVLTSGLPSGRSADGNSVLFGSGAVALPSNCAYIRFYVTNQYGNTYNNDIAINNPSTVTIYSPYSNICPISGHSSVTITRTDAESQTADFTIQLGQTVYGGTVNLVTGAASVNMAAIDLGDLEWSAVNGSRFLAVNQMPGVKINTSVSEQRNAICSQYVWKKGGDLFNQDDPGFSYYIEGGENRLFVKDLRYATAQAFTTAMDGVTLVYELATPIELTLTPVAVEMLKGYNQISSDGGGDITVEAYTGAAWGGDE